MVGAGVGRVVSKITLHHVRLALRRPLPGAAAQKRMSPRPRPGDEPLPPGYRPKEAAVLILVYPVDGVPHLVLTKRTETVAYHKGQISLPGGAREGDEDLTNTALREAREELGIDTDGLDILASLTPLYVATSDYLIAPLVALAPTRPVFHPDPVEVDELIETPLALLVDPACRAEEDWEVRGFRLRVPFFCIGPHKVWGATAMILSELAAVLEGQDPANGRTAAATGGRQAQ